MAVEPFKGWSQTSSAAATAAGLICTLSVAAAFLAVSQPPAWGGETATTESPPPKKKVVITVGVPSKTMTKPSFTLTPVSFADLPGWAEDDHLSAWKAFLTSCPVLIQRSDAGKASKPMSQALAGACRFALEQVSPGRKMTKASARAPKLEANRS